MGHCEVSLIIIPFVLAREKTFAKSKCISILYTGVASKCMSLNLCKRVFVSAAVHRRSTVSLADRTLHRCMSSERSAFICDVKVYRSVCLYSLKPLCTRYPCLCWSFNGRHSTSNASTLNAPTFQRHVQCWKEIMSYKPNHHVLRKSPLA